MSTQYPIEDGPIVVLASHRNRITAKVATSAIEKALGRPVTLLVTPAMGADEPSTDRHGSASSDTSMLVPPPEMDADIAAVLAEMAPAINEATRVIPLFHDLALRDPAMMWAVSWSLICRDSPTGYAAGVVPAVIGPVNLHDALIRRFGTPIRLYARGADGVAELITALHRRVDTLERVRTDEDRAAILPALAPLSMGRALRRSGDWSKATRYFEQALTLADEGSDAGARARIEVLTALGDLELDRGLAQSARAHLEEAAEIGARLGLDSILIRIGRLLGVVLMLDDEADHGMDRLQETLELAEKNKDLAGVILLRNTMAAQVEESTHNEDAEQHYLAALGTRSGSNPDRLGLSVTLANYAGWLANAGKTDDAIQRYKECLALQELIGDDLGRAQVLNHAGTLLTNAGRFKGARQLLQLARDIRHRHEDTLGEARTLLRMVDLERAAGDWAAAGSAASKAEELATAAKHPRTAGRAAFMLAVIATKTENFGHARAHIERALEQMEVVDAPELSEARRLRRTLADIASDIASSDSSAAT